MNEARTKGHLVDSLVTKFWDWRLLNAPEYATSVGCHTYDGRLDDFSLNSYGRIEAEGKLLLSEAKVLQQEDDSFSREANLNLRLVVADLEQLLNGLKFKAYLLPTNVFSGPHTFSVEKMKKDTLADMNLILQRLSLLKHQVDEIISLMEEGIRIGMVSYKGVIEKLPQIVLKIASVPSEESQFFKPFLQKPVGIMESQWDDVVSRGREIMETKVNPSLSKFASYLSKRYLNHARSSISVYSLPNGKELYAACLRFHTTTNMTAKEVHELGIAEVDRITKCMHAVKEKVGYKESLEDFKRYLNTDEKFKFKDSNEILTHYEHICKEIEIKLGLYFLVLPKARLIVKPIPGETAPFCPLGYYHPSNSNEDPVGTFYVNTSKPEIRKKYDALALCLHEAIPGHHLQMSLTMESGAIPAFRRLSGSKRYLQVPGYFAMNTGYLEGWGLYAEYLGEEMDLYENPFDLFGRLSSEMLRACRLVVDTGIHAFDWSKERAVRYMEEKTSMDRIQMVAEVDRYTITPGQACAYKIGELKIKEIRSKAERQFGDTFDIAKFHHFVASMGPVPLDILESKVDDFVNQLKSECVSRQ